MKKRALIVLSVVTIAVASLLLSNCDLSQIEIQIKFYNVSGDVVNTKAPSSGSFYKNGSTSTLVGSTITFTNASDSSKTYTGSVGSDGTYAISSVPNGKYNVSGTSSGWTFIPQMVTVSDTLSSFDVLAFPTASASELTVVMSWTNPNRDMDLHMTYGASNSTDNSGNHIYWSNTSVSDTGSFYFNGSLDRDVSTSPQGSANFPITNQPLVETITVAPNSFNSGIILSGTEFRFYVDAYSKAAGTTGNADANPAVEAAGVVVDVFQGNTHDGSFYVPYDTAGQTLRVAKVDIGSSNAFTVWPDVESADSGSPLNGIKSFASGRTIVGIPVSAIK